MSKKLDPEVEYLVRPYSRGGLSQRKIVETLKASGHKISKTCVFNIVNCIGNRRNHKLFGLPSPQKTQPSRTVTKAMIHKIDVLTLKENPQSQRFILSLIHI